MFGIATGGGRRGQTDLDWRAKAWLFSGAALATSAFLGLVLGAVGSLVPEEARITAGAVAAVLLAAVGLAHLRLSSRHELLERDCETAQSWLEHGPVGWALINGAALGSGFWSRIGFVSWYVVPVASFAFGSPLLGAIVYGLYGGVRGFAVWCWAFGMRRADSDQVIETVLGLSTMGKRISAALLVALASTTIVIAGV